MREPGHSFFGLGFKMRAPGPEPVSLPHEQGPKKTRHGLINRALCMDMHRFTPVSLINRIEVTQYGADAGPVCLTVGSISCVVGSRLGDLPY